MKSLTIKILSIALVSVLISCNSSDKQTAEASTENKNQVETTSTEQKIAAIENNTLEVIQFHSTNRCMTCQKIERLTQEVLAEYGAVPFKLISVDEKQNEAIAEKFEASGTALFLHNTATGEFKNLTEFAFMTAGNEEKFHSQLKAEILKF